MSDLGRKDDRKPRLTVPSPLRERRQFLRRAGKVAITAPAVALLLSTASKQAAGAIDTGPALSGIAADTFADPPN
jgi:hypothetical protein